MSRTEYKNAHTKANYDRLELIVNKGNKDRIKATATSLGMSVNEYIWALVCEDTAAGASKLGQKKQGFTEEQQEMLKKWQVSKKYYEMIEDMSYAKDSGYFIYLKGGYINDVTKSRSVHCGKTSELRKIIVKTRKIQ